MRKTTAALVLGLPFATMAALTVPANAQSPQPLALSPSSPFQVQQVLDGQGCYPDPDQSCWVKNPTFDRAWNDQDDVYYTGTGYVDPGAPAAFPARLFADFTSTTGNLPHSIYVDVWSSANNVTVTLANDHGDAWQVGPPAKVGSRYEWLFCTRDPVAVRGGVPNNADPSLYWPVVPGSNYLPGSTVYGYAEPVAYTLTITATDRRARDVYAGFEIAGSGPLTSAPRSIRTCET